MAIDSKKDEARPQWGISLTNLAKRALRPIETGRKNLLFAGTDTGAETLARAMKVIAAVKLDGLDRRDVLLP